MTGIRVLLGERSYDIHITSDDPSGVGAFARQRSSGLLAFVVGDSNVTSQAEAVASSLGTAGFRVVRASVPAGEESKSLARASGLYDQLADARADRGTLIVAVGGGVVGDLAGFVAATWNRGLDLLMVPTTLLAMVDSAVGGKVGINHPRGKNLIGAFHQPRGVWIDTAMLATLPDREYRSGLAEVVKYGVILDAELFRFLEDHVGEILGRQSAAVEHLVARSCQLKASIVEQDERELTGLRAVLNYGHTFAHAFETVAGYGAWLHGEAVAAGMVCASLLAEKRSLVKKEVPERQRALLRAFGLPTAPDRGWDVDALVGVMRSDKKAVGGRLRFVLVRRLGGEVSLFDDIDEGDVRRVLEEARTGGS
jgi:3-dehydroquinate synthase